MALAQLVVGQPGLPELPDVRVVADEVDAVVLAVDHVHRPVRRPGISQQLHLATVRAE